MIILKVPKNQGFTLSLEDTFFKKPLRDQFDTTPSRFKIKIKRKNICNKYKAVGLKMFIPLANL